MARKSKRATPRNAPGNPAPGAGGFTRNHGAGAPATLPVASMTAESGRAPAFRAVGSALLAVRQAARAGGGRAYEVEAEVRQIEVGLGEAPRARLYVRSLDGDHADLAPVGAASGPLTPALATGQVIVLKQRFAAKPGPDAVAWGEPAKAALLRFSVHVNTASGGGDCPRSIAEIRRLTVREIPAGSVSRT